MLAAECLVSFTLRLTRFQYEIAGHEMIWFFENAKKECVLDCELGGETQKKLTGVVYSFL
jgi:hypothetical protein